MRYQLGWTTLPGLRGLSVSEFRAIPTDAPNIANGAREAADERGVTMEFENDGDKNAFLREIEMAFASRRFTNVADAFDTVKAYVLERAPNR